MLTRVNMSQTAPKADCPGEEKGLTRQWVLYTTSRRCRDISFRKSKDQFPKLLNKKIEKSYLNDEHSYIPWAFAQFPRCEAADARKGAGDSHGLLKDSKLYLYYFHFNMWELPTCAQNTTMKAILQPQPPVVSRDPSGIWTKTNTWRQ